MKTGWPDRCINLARFYLKNLVCFFKLTETGQVGFLGSCNEGAFSVAVRCACLVEVKRRPMAKGGKGRGRPSSGPKRSSNNGGVLFQPLRGVPFDFPFALVFLKAVGV
jgi:hypothetical protein